MNNKLNYQSWYDKQNSDKSNLLYERLTKQFVGRNLLNEEENQQIQAALNYDLASNKELMNKTKKTVGKKLSTLLGIDLGTTEGQQIAELAAKFVLNHVIEIQIKGQEKEVKENPSMIKDLYELVKAIVLNAAKENKELFNQLSSGSRAKAGAEVLGKQISKDVGEFGSELSRTGKQTWADIKNRASSLFEAAPAAGVGAAGTALATSTASALTTTGAAMAPEAVAVATTGAKIVAGAKVAADVSVSLTTITASFAKMSLIFALTMAALATILNSAGLLNLGFSKVKKKAEKAAGMKTPGLIGTVFGDEDEEEETKKSNINCSDEDYVTGKCK